MPQPPYRYRGSDAPKFDLLALGSRIQESEQKRQESFAVARTLQMAMAKARDQMELDLDGESSSSTTALQPIQDSLLKAIGGGEQDNDDSNRNRKPRDANLSHRVEEYCRLLALNHFWTTGQVLPPSTVSSFATDEEYLGGACMGLCQDLSRYGMGRATARDVASVQAARDLVQELLDFLLQFDFRNGYLRRKYDGTKYALKNLETILYELSITGAGEGSVTTTNDDEPDAKRTKMEETASTSPSSPKDELMAICKRMEHRDLLREKLIKKCRDGQKAAKQAIYALHRGDPKKAATLIQQCEECIMKELLPIVEEEPPLRSGSFANVMEEYAEAKLFYVWLLGKGDEIENVGEASKDNKASGIVLTLEDFDAIKLEPEEYLGGICDLTGEIGRYAVQRGTTRDVMGVKQCLEANAAILVAIQTMERFPSGIGKKMDQLRRSVEKLERMTYEMSLSEAAGGRKVDTEDVQPGPEKNANYND